MFASCAMLRICHTIDGCCLLAVGQLAAHSALVKGAEKVAIVDSVQYRMDYVKKWLPEVQTIDFSKVQVDISATSVIPTATIGMCYSVVFRGSLQSIAVGTNAACM